MTACTLSLGLAGCQANHAANGLMGTATNPAVAGGGTGGGIGVINGPNINAVALNPGSITAYTFDTATGAVDDRSRSMVAFMTRDSNTTLDFKRRDPCRRLQCQQQLRQQRRWTFASFLTLAPSTNFNQGASDATVLINGLPFTLDDGSVRKSGIGLVTGFNAGYRHPLGDDVDLVVSVGGVARQYREAIFNAGFGEIAVGPRGRFDWGTIGAYATFDQNWEGEARYANTIGGRISSTVRLAPRQQLTSEMSCGRRRFNEDWKGKDISYRDGSVCRVAGHIDHKLDSSSFARALGGIGHEKTDARMAHLDNRHWQLGAGLYRELPFGVSVYAEARYTRRNYDGSPFFDDDKRKDGRWDLGLHLTKRDLEIMGFAPTVQYTYTTNVSSIGFYTFDAHGLNVTLTKDF